MKSRSPISLKRQSIRIDKKVLATAVGLTIFGILMVADASAVQAFQNFGDRFYYAKQQAVWAGLGIASMLIFSQVPYRIFKKLAVSVFIASLLLLVSVFIPGLGFSALGATRWISIGSIVIQPSEFAKFALIIYLAATLSHKSRLIPVLFALGLVSLLVMLQPDLGTTLIIGGAAASIYFASGAPFIQFILLGAAGLVSVLGLILTSDYRRRRLISFFDPGSDPLGVSYHIRQILIALGSGGLFGVGLGQSRQKYLFIPETTTDSIFAIIAEETGFVGSLVIISLFVFLFWRGLEIARTAEDRFGSLLAVGIISWIAIQALINLSAIVALVPLTGVPLPFISYGGSSLIAILSGIGVLLNISKSGVSRKAAR